MLNSTTLFLHLYPPLAASLSSPLLLLPLLFLLHAVCLLSPSECWFASETTLDRFSVLSITHERHLAEITVLWRVCIDQSLYVSRVLRKLNAQPSFRSVQEKLWGWVHWRAMTWFYTVSLAWKIQPAISNCSLKQSSAKRWSDVKMENGKIALKCLTFVNS